MAALLAVAFLALFAPSVAAQATTLSSIARSHYQIGTQYLQSGLTTRALEEFQKAASADSSFLDAHLQAANLLVTLNRGAEAVPYYRRAVALARTRPDLHFALADAARLGGDLATARQFYASGLAINPNQISAILALAQIQIQAGAFAEAQRTLTVSPALANDPGVLALRAYVAHRLGRLDEAASLYQKVLERQPDNGDVRLNLGIVEAARRNPAAAVEHFKRAALLVRDKGPVYRYLGVVLHDLGRYAEAVESLRRAIGENPADMIARFRMADALLKISRPAEALGHLEAIRQASGNLPELDLLFGQAYLGIGQPVRAREALERATASRPADTVALAALAEVYQKIGETRSAIELNRRLLAMGVENPEMHRNLADLYALLGDSVRALEHERLYRDMGLRQDVASSVSAERRLWESRFAELSANADRRVADERTAADARIRDLEARTAATIASLRAEADSRVHAIEDLSHRQIEELKRAQAAAPAGAPAEIERLRAEYEARLVRETERLARDYEERLAAARRDPSAAGAAGMTDREREQARAQIEALQARIARLTASLEASHAGLATDTMRRRLIDLSAEVEKERATREEAMATAERIRATAELQVREMQGMVTELSVEIDRGLLEAGLETGPRAGDKIVPRLKHFVQHVRLAADARVARSQLQAEARLADVRTRSESEVSRIMREARAQVDRARLQAAEEVRRAQTAADSQAVAKLAQERERLAAEALARRMALAEQLRAQIEADAQIRYLEEKSRIEATYEADRIRMQRDYDQQLQKFEVEFQRRLEAAQLEVKRTREQMEALTSSDTSLLMRSEVYQRIVRENALLREDLAGSRRRLEELGRDKEELVREGDALRREFANVQGRLGALEAEVRRYQGIAVLAEPLQKGININAASIEELQVLPGIGVQEARNIVWYRENVGLFRGVEELSKVPGIDAARAQVIRGLIRIR